MSLSTAELQRIKFELGYNVLSNGAEPFIGVSMLFENIVAVYMTAGAATTSATTVVAASVPTNVAVTLASATGFSAGALAWVGVDDAQESATVQSISGAIITLALKNAHAGTYPVTVDGGEAMVRELLSRIRAVKAELSGTFGEGALKKVDEIEFYQTGASLFASTGKALMFWRDELASLLGITNMWRMKRAAGSSISMY